MSSYAYTIANAMKTAIEAISNPPTVVLRKSPWLIKGDTLPICVIAVPDETGELWSTFGDGSTDHGSFGKNYVYNLGVYRSFDGQVQTNVDTLAAIRLAINQALNNPTLSGASTVWNVSISGGNGFEFGAFGSNNEKSMFRITVGSNELRNG